MRAILFDKKLKKVINIIEIEKFDDIPLEKNQVLIESPDGDFVDTVDTVKMEVVKKGA